MNNSSPTDVLFTPQQIQGNKRDIVFMASFINRGGTPPPQLQGFDQNKYLDLYTLLKNVTASDDSKYTVQMQDDEEPYNLIPTNKVSIPVDIDYVKKTMPFNPTDSIVSELKLDIKKSYIQKNDLAVLAIIAANKWRRPLYFTSIQELADLGLDKYVRLEGMSYRLCPVENPNNVEMEVAFKNIMEGFAWGNAGDKRGVYYDEENRRHINDIRQSHAFVAMALDDANKLDSAKKILHKYDDNVLEKNCSYGFTSNRGNFHNRVSATFLYAAYRAGDLALAKKVSTSMKTDLEQQMKYYRSLGDEGMSNEQLAMQAAQLLQGRAGNLSDKQEQFAQDIYSSYDLLNELNAWETQFNPGAKKPPIEGIQQIQTGKDTSKKPKDTAKHP